MSLITFSVNEKGALYQAKQYIRVYHFPMIVDTEKRVLVFEVGDTVSFIVPKPYKQWGFGKMADLDGTDVEVLNTALALRREGLFDALSQQKVYPIGWDENTYELSAKELVERTERKNKERYTGILSK